MAEIRFTETALRSQGKKGILKPDENGYYTMVIGGLNCYNSAGEYYVAKGATDLFSSSSHLIRRIETGQLRAENGHPTREPGMSTAQWVQRIMTINPDSVCAHFAEIWLDINYGKNHPECGNPDLIAIMARVKPSGPFGPSLKESFENPEENVAFSIRSLTENELVNGRMEKTISQVITFDYVIEPGIKGATKWATPTLEELTKDILTKEMIVRISNEAICAGPSMEASRAIFMEAVEKYSPRLVATKSKLADWK